MPEDVDIQFLEPEPVGSDHQFLLHLPDGPHLLHTGGKRPYVEAVTKEQGIDFLDEEDSASSLSLAGYSAVSMDRIGSIEVFGHQHHSIETVSLTGEPDATGSWDLNRLEDLYVSGDSIRLVRLVHESKVVYGLLENYPDTTARLILFLPDSKFDRSSSWQLKIRLEETRRKLASDDQELARMSYQIRESMEQSLRHDRVLVEPLFEEDDEIPLYAELLAGRYVRLKQSDFESAADKKMADEETQEMERVVRSVQTSRGRTISALGRVTFQFDLTHLLYDTRVREEDLIQGGRIVEEKYPMSEQSMLTIGDGDLGTAPPRIVVDKEELEPKTVNGQTEQAWWLTPHQVDSANWPFDVKYIGQVDVLLTHLEVARKEFGSREAVNGLYQSLNDRLSQLFPLMDGRDSDTNTTIPAPNSISMDSHGYANADNDFSYLGLPLGINEINHWFRSADNYVKFLDANGHFRQSPKGEREYYKRKMYIDIFGHTISYLTDRGLWHELPQVLWQAQVAINRHI